jgi:hypothetical protein
MQLRRFALFVLAACLLCGCKGGGGFVPTAGAFDGQFLVAGESIGTFTVVVGNGQFGGGGTLIHNAQNVNVAVSALITGEDITGRVENASLGHGSFTGRFNGYDRAQGTFTYADNGGISTTEGTWTAEHQ